MKNEDSIDQMLLNLGELFRYIEGETLQIKYRQPPQVTILKNVLKN